MARARNIKPGFFRNADLVELSFEARLLFIGLWTIADREGRLEDRPKQIKMELFPADNLDCDAILNSLAEIGMISRYEHDGKRYLQVVNFKKHQNPHKDERASTIPSNGEHSASTVQAPCEEDATSEVVGLIPDSLIPDSLIAESKSGGDSCESPSRPLPKNKKKSDAIGRRFTDQDILKPEWISYCNDVRPDLDPKSVFEDFRCHWLSKAGADARKTNWDLTWQGWVRRQHKKQNSAYDRKMQTLSGLTGGIHGSSDDGVFKPITETKTIDMECSDANLLR
jgi:hypothetical protein